jgi:hypothetical protein
MFITLAMLHLTGFGAFERLHCRRVERMTIEINSDHVCVDDPLHVLHLSVL